MTGRSAARRRPRPRVSRPERARSGAPARPARRRRCPARLGHRSSRPGAPRPRPMASAAVGWLSSPAVAAAPGRRPGSCRPRRGRRPGARPGTPMTACARTAPWTGTTGRSSTPWPGRAATCRARPSAAGPRRRSPPFACAHPAGCGPLWTALRVTTGQQFQATPGNGLTAGIRETGTPGREAPAAVRYREDTPGELARARAAVAAWRDRNPSSKDTAQPPVADRRRVGDKEAAPAQPMSQVSHDSRHARSATWMGSPVRKRFIASAASRISSSSCSLWIGSQTKMTMLSWTNV